MGRVKTEPIRVMGIPGRVADTAGLEEVTGEATETGDRKTGVLPGVTGPRGDSQGVGTGDGSTATLKSGR